MTTKLHFWDVGDRSAGIGSNQAEIVLELDGSSAEETTENIAHAKQVLCKALGEIYANLPDYLLDAFADQRSWLGGRKPKDVGGTFKVVEATYERLRQVIDNGLRKHLEPEVTVTPVIRYNIESHVSFAEDEKGNIVPNAGFPGSKWNVENEKLYGSHHAAKPAPGGYSLVIGARAMLKRVIRHGSNERVEYELFYAGGSHHGHENPAELLNSWRSMNLGDSPKEIPYTEKAALFFHSLLLGMATLNRQVQMATFQQDTLLALIEKQSSRREGNDLPCLCNPCSIAVCHG